MSQQPADTLSLLYRAAQSFNSSLDLNTVLENVLDEVVTATRAERGFIMLREAGGTLAFRVARQIDLGRIDSPDAQISHTVVRKVFTTGEPMLTYNAQEDETLQSESVVLLGLRSVLCVPLQARHETLGVIYVDNRWKSGVFSKDALNLLVAIANTAATAIENARLYALAVDKGRLERELQVAREVQASLIPRGTPSVAGWEFAAWWQPARAVSGDFYDFIPRAGGELGLVIADVSDKGMPAALFMALSRSIVRASLTAAQPLDAAISQANRLISADATNGMFVTLAAVELMANEGRIRFVNGGHNPPLVYHTGSGVFEPLERTGILLGLDEDWPFTQGEATLAVGDWLILYTDGVTDATPDDDALFGLERLKAVIRQHAQHPAGEMVADLQYHIGQFTGAHPQFDDITLVVARRV